MEAKVIMDIAHLDGTLEFTLDGIKTKKMAGAQRTTVDLNEAPFKMQEEHLNRMKALCRTGNDALHLHAFALYEFIYIYIYICLNKPDWCSFT